MPGAVNTHLKTGSLTPEVYTQTWDEKGGGGEQNQSTHDITVRTYVFVVGLAQAIFQVRKIEPYEIKVLGITMHSSLSRGS